MVTTTKKLTADDLWRMLEKERYELWHGELVEVSPSFIESSAIAILIAVRLSTFVEPRKLGLVTGADGGYLLFENRDTVVAPDVGFTLWEKLPERKRVRGFSPIPPSLAVEVKSPSDESGNIKRKLALYMEAGVPLVWWVDPVKERVIVYRPGQPGQTCRVGDVLEGGKVLPGFRLPVADIFAV